MNLHTLHTKKNKNQTKQQEMFNVGGASSNTGILRPTDRNQQSASDLLNSAMTNSNKIKIDPNDGLTNITLYSNGFMIADDETFYDYSKSNSQKFLSDMKKGIIPKEIERKLPQNKKSLQVRLIDKTSETYKPKFVTFTGKGHSFGKQKGKNIFKKTNSILSEQNKNFDFKIDDSKPKTSLQIITHDGNKVKATFNTSQTVFDIYRYIIALTGYKGNFQIMSGFPPKILNDHKLTIEQAGLINTIVRQKI